MVEELAILIFYPWSEKLLCIYNKKIYIPKWYGFITLFRARGEN